MAFLTEHERRDPLWLKLKAHAEERLASMRSKNDTNLDERKTARLRGRIAELKHLAALDSSVPQTEADDE